LTGISKFVIITFPTFELSSTPRSQAPRINTTDSSRPGEVPSVLTLQEIVTRNFVYFRIAHPTEFFVWERFNIKPRRLISRALDPKRHQLYVPYVKKDVKKEAGLSINILKVSAALAEGKEVVAVTTTLPETMLSIDTALSATD
jgi:hypothetical protein